MYVNYFDLIHVLKITVHKAIKEINFLEERHLSSLKDKNEHNGEKCTLHPPLRRVLCA